MLRSERQSTVSTVSSVRSRASSSAKLAVSNLVYNFNDILSVSLIVEQICQLENVHCCLCRYVNLCVCVACICMCIVWVCIVCVCVLLCVVCVV